MLGPIYFKQAGCQKLITNDTGNYAFLTEEQFSMLTNDNFHGDLELIEELERKGFYFSKSPEVFVRQQIHPLRDGNSYLFDATNLFILAMTNICNNRCLYCQADGENAPCHMSIEVAEKALQRIQECSSRQITIEFQGGEPLTNFQVIRYIVTRSDEVLKNKTVHFALVSNLRLMTEDIAAFLKNHHFSVSTSLDGPRALHDWNRPGMNGEGTFQETIERRKMLTSYGINCGAIQTTTRKSLHLAKEIIDTYVENGFSMIFLRPLTRLGAAARKWDEIGYTADEYLAFYSKALNIILDYNRKGMQLTEYFAAVLLSKILFGRSQNYMELRSPCGAGTGQVAITANGNVYTCDEGRMMAEMGDEAFYIGNVYQNTYRDWINSTCCQATSAASLLDTLPGCCDCAYKPYCGVCPVVNYAINGNATHVSKEKCRVNKGILDILFEYIKDGDDEIMKILSRWGGNV